MANSLFYSANKTQAYSLTKVTRLFNGSPKYEALYKSEKDDYSIVEVTYKQGSAHVFVSERSGSSQLWISQKGLTKQLSYFSYDGPSNYVLGGLKVSSNQQRILLRKNKTFAFYDMNTEKLYPLEEFNGRKIVSYIWSASNESILYIEKLGEKNRVAEFNLLTRDTTVMEDIKASKLISDDEGNGYAISHNQLIRLSDGQSWGLSKEASKANIYAVRDNYLYYSDSISRVARLNLQDRTIQDVHMDFRPITFEISADNEILFTGSKYKDMQIVQISWDE